MNNLLGLVLDSFSGYGEIKLEMIMSNDEHDSNKDRVWTLVSLFLRENHESQFKKETEDIEVPTSGWTTLGSCLRIPTLEQSSKGERERESRSDKIVYFPYKNQTERFET